MEYLLVIPGKIHNLNDYIKAERTNRYEGAKMKAQDGEYISVFVRHCLNNIKIKKPVFMEYTWYEPNRRRDKSNISGYGRKVIEDFLVDCGVLGDDGWDYVVGFSDRFKVDRGNPRIEVLIKEVTM